MKLKFVLAIYVILLLLLLSACGRGQITEAEPPASAYPADTERDTALQVTEYPAVSDINNGTVPAESPETPRPTPGPLPLTDIFHSGNTRAEYLQDLDYLYEILKSNFPHINALYRGRGVDLHELFANARHTLETANPNRNFNAILNSTIFSQVNWFGHMAILDADAVRFRLALFSGEDNPNAPFVDVIDNPASRAFYRLNDADFQPQAQDEWMQEITAAQQGNVSTRIIQEGRIAYVRILQMSVNTIEVDYAQLIDFYKSVADYDHLIIDIRGNGGGSDGYFPALVMAPNINETLYYNQYLFFMAGDHNMRFLEPLMEIGWMQWVDIQPVHPELFNSLPYFHHEDRDILDYYIRITGQVTPSRDEGIFGGKIWLLIDGSNFSASGIAVEIAKETGFATLVGMPTGSSGMGINPTIIGLPNSGIIVQYQTLYSTNFTGRNSYEYGAEPHVRNFDGMDALETTLALIEQGGY